jgi:WD40 repeat protein
MDFLASVSVPPSTNEPSWVLSLTCDVPGQRLAAATSRRELCLYDRPTLQPVLTLEAHAARVNELCFAPAGSVLYSAASDGLIRAWDCKAKPADKPSCELRDPTAPEEEVWSLSLGTGHTLAAGTEGAVVIWDLRKAARPLCRWEVHTEAVTQVHFFEGGKRLLSGSMDGACCGHASNRNAGRVAWKLLSLTTWTVRPAPLPSESAPSPASQGSSASSTPLKSRRMTLC